jgi:ribosome-associated protein
VSKNKTEDLKHCIIEALREKKAFEIVCINMKKLYDPPSDIFIICHGSSNTHIEAMANEVEKKVRENCHEKPALKEGMQNKEWILLDYFDIVVHIFQEEKRRFYSLEDLWSDGEFQNYTEDKQENSNDRQTGN